MKSEDLISELPKVILDVRSPSEYAKGNIPGALLFPLFSDEERREVGIVYKKEGKDKALEKGFRLIKIDQILERMKTIPRTLPVIVYCARGGMRSSSIGWLLQQYGYKVEILEGGYKFFRRWALRQFGKSYCFRILGGKTGVGKTDVLHELASLGEDVIDLEGLAVHKGSVFGGEKEHQPTQQQFENGLAIALFLSKKTIWLEDESQDIGAVRIPQEIFSQMSRAFTCILEMDGKRRTEQTIGNYLSLGDETLRKKIIMIKKRLGAERAQSALIALDKGEFPVCCEILFSYYDKKYSFGISKREKSSLYCLTMGDKSFSEVARELVEKRDSIQMNDGERGRLSCV